MGPSFEVFEVRSRKDLVLDFAGKTKDSAEAEEPFSIGTVNHHEALNTGAGSHVLLNF